MRTGIFRTAQAVSDSVPDTSEYLAPGPKRREAERRAQERVVNKQYGGGLTALSALGYTTPTSSSPTLDRLMTKGGIKGDAFQPRELCKGSLLVATPDGSASAAKPRGAAGVNEWKKFDFTHHHDGRFTLRSGSEPALGSAAGASTALPAPWKIPENEEYLLDADWRKPFIAAPLQPLHRSAKRSGESTTGAAAAAAAATGSGSASDPAAQSLYPFTLSYEPVSATPGELEYPAPARRTVVLAATDLQSRQKWMNTFSQKATTRPMRIRPEAPHAYPTSIDGLSPPTRIAGIGERHAGVPTMTAATASAPSISSSSGAGGQSSWKHPRKQLSAGHAGLWDKCSKLKIVRELYDGYAADPVGEVERSKRAQSTASPQAAASRRLLERYVERQAKLEGLLEERRGTGRFDFHKPSKRSALKTPSTAGIDGLTDEEGGSAQPSPQGNASVAAAIFEATELTGPAPCPFPLVGHTPNMTVDGTTLQNDEWSAGCMFDPKDVTRFKLTVKPEDRVDWSPIFVGIAPADSDLTMVNFFDVGGGVFLCMGGIASEALIASLGAPGGPSFHAFGQRSVAELPVASQNATISVEYCEDIPDGKTHPEGQVLFSIIEPNAEEGDGAFYARPLLKKRLACGKWRPVVLLCMPNTRMNIVSLT